jgi:hypothetical protein
MAKKKQVIIGYCGAIGSGKSTRANRLVTSSAYVNKNFADTLRKLAWSILNWQPANEEEYEKFKLTPVAVLYIFKTVSPKAYLTRLLFNLACYVFSYTQTGRDLLQRLGNEAREKIHQDVWVLAWETSILEANHVVVSDVRYPNEIIKIILLGGRIIFCNYKSPRYKLDNHASEAIAVELVGKGFLDGEDVTDYFIKKYKIKEK